MHDRELLAQSPADKSEIIGIGKNARPPQGTLHKHEPDQRVGSESGERATGRASLLDPRLGQDNSADSTSKEDVAEATLIQLLGGLDPLHRDPHSFKHKVDPLMSKRGESDLEVKQHSGSKPSTHSTGTDSTTPEIEDTFFDPSALHEASLIRGDNFPTKLSKTPIDHQGKDLRIGVGQAKRTSVRSRLGDPCGPSLDLTLREKHHVGLIELLGEIHAPFKHSTKGLMHDLSS